MTREENRVQVFPSSLRVRTLEEAPSRLQTAPIEDYRRQLLALVDALMKRRSRRRHLDRRVDGRDRPDRSRSDPRMDDLEGLGIASNDTAVTAFVHAGVRDSSQKRLRAAGGI